MMTSNEINMNIAAVTPVVLFLYGINRVSRFLFYALLRVKKSREEIYSSFRHVMLDIERLLLMRNNPPSVPPPLTWTNDGHPITVPAPTVEEPRGPSVLNSDDLGMLMLHIHECRTILWEDSRRFSSQILRDVEEDLAELAGERGMYFCHHELIEISSVLGLTCFFVLYHARRCECGAATVHHCTHVPNILVPQGRQYKGPRRIIERDNQNEV